MDSNYQWQKQRVQERIYSRLEEADARRLLSKDSPDHRFTARRLWKSLLDSSHLTSNPGYFSITRIMFPDGNR